MVCPKNPGLSRSILRMGLEPETVLFDREGSGFLGVYQPPGGCLGITPFFNSFIYWINPGLFCVLLMADMASWNPESQKTSAHWLVWARIFRHESLTWKSLGAILSQSQSPQSSYGGLMENDSFDDFDGSINKTKWCFNIILFRWCLMILSEHFQITLTPNQVVKWWFWNPGLTLPLDLDRKKRVTGYQGLSVISLLSNITKEVDFRCQKNKKIPNAKWILVLRCFYKKGKLFALRCDVPNFFYSFTTSKIHNLWFLINKMLGNITIPETNEFLHLKMDRVGGRSAFPIGIRPSLTGFCC